MPARVIDGDGLWRSKKVKKMTPRYKGEYANLVPLAEANGVFDCDPERVWSDVYAFNRPEITLEEVVLILDELEDVDLLRRWSEKGKTWGYWVGIHKSGRLPPASHLNRYKHLPPNAPEDIRSDDDLSGRVRDSPGQIRTSPSRIGLDWIGNGLVLERPAQEPETIFSETEEHLHGDEMNAVKQIPIICKTILGVYADMSPVNTSMLKALEAEHKGSAVVNIFTQWAKEHKYDEIKKPIAAFLKESDDLFAVSSSSSILTGTSENGRKVGREISYISNQEINLDKKQTALVAAAMAEEDYSEEEVYTVFRTFYLGINRENAGEVSFAPKKFSEVVGNLLYANRRKKQELNSEKIAMDAARDKMQEEVSEKVSAILKKKQEEKNSLEDDFA